MKEVVAFMLARLGGNDKPSKEDVSKILDSVGIKAEAEKLDALFADLEKLSCSVDEAIKTGMDKLAIIPAGGGGGGGGAAAAGGAAATGGAEAKAEEEEEESKSSSKAGGNLFGGDDDDSDESSD
mmetsp:Transcript_70036/g.111393  ORF Transcript_70036/g.111393 Transcript_70036/m.111393 type:complete len:125 (+) Transcript_70036:210-584(+)